MNKQKSTITTLAVLSIICLATVALAQGPGARGGGNGGRGNGMAIERMAQRLDLTLEQVEAIKEIREKGREENVGLRKDMMKLRNEKRGEMLEDSPSSDKVLKLTRQIGDLRTEMQTNRMSNRLEVRKVLTPAQRDKMLLMGERRGNGQGEGRGGRGGNGGQCDFGGKGGRGQQKGNGNGQCDNDGPQNGRRGARNG